MPIQLKNFSKVSVPFTDYNTIYWPILKKLGRLSGVIIQKDMGGNVPKSFIDDLGFIRMVQFIDYRRTIFIQKPVDADKMTSEFYILYIEENFIAYNALLTILAILLKSIYILGNTHLPTVSSDVVSKEREQLILRNDDIEKLFSDAISSLYTKELSKDNEKVCKRLIGNAMELANEIYNDLRHKELQKNGNNA